MQDAVGGATSAHVVLYIEDNSANLRLVDRAFERRPDIELITATRGLVGLELARIRQPSVVLLDLHLPDVDGDEVLCRLRADPVTQAIPVVMLSADANDRQIQRLLEAGAVAYLTKPLDIHNLLETVDDVIPPTVRAPST
jgi:CheY-like chemotaxis protein